MEAGRNCHCRLLAVIAITGIILTAHTSTVQSRNLVRRELHPIDLCIFTCDFCYKGETLLSCANECITTEASMSSAWAKTCKLFKGESPDIAGLHTGLFSSGRNFPPVQ